MSKLIAIEGIDGAGKSTQVRLVSEKLRKAGMKVKTHAFPSKGTPVGDMIYDILFGKIEANKTVLELLHTADKVGMQDEIKQWLQEYDVVILDRYTTSQIAYAMATGISYSWVKLLQSPCLRAFDIMVDVHPNVAKLRREGKDKDSYETNELIQEVVRRNMHDIIPIGQRVDGSREPEDIAKDIALLIMNAPNIAL